jgi:hypothetical protein
MMHDYPLTCSANNGILIVNWQTSPDSRQPKDYQPIFGPVLVSFATLSYSDNAVIGVGTGKSLRISSAHVNFLLSTVADK